MTINYCIFRLQFFVTNIKHYIQKYILQFTTHSKILLLLLPYTTQNSIKSSILSVMIRIKYVCACFDLLDLIFFYNFEHMNCLQYSVGQSETRSVNYLRSLCFYLKLSLFGIFLLLIQLQWSINADKLTQSLITKSLLLMCLEKNTVGHCNIVACTAEQNRSNIEL